MKVTPRFVGEWIVVGLCAGLALAMLGIAAAIVAWAWGWSG